MGVCRVCQLLLTYWTNWECVQIEPYSSPGNFGNHYTENVSLMATLSDIIVYKTYSSKQHVKAVICRLTGSCCWQQESNGQPAVVGKLSGRSTSVLLSAWGRRPIRVSALQPDTITKTNSLSLSSVCWHKIKRRAPLQNCTCCSFPVILPIILSFFTFTKLPRQRYRAQSLKISEFPLLWSPVDKIQAAVSKATLAKAFYCSNKQLALLCFHCWQYWIEPGCGDALIQINVW